MTYQLPEPDTHCYDEDTNTDCWSFSREILLQEIAKAELRGREAMLEEHQQTIHANQCLVAALDRIHDVLNGVYVDDVALIINRALAANKELRK